MLVILLHALAYNLCNDIEYGTCIHCANHICNMAECLDDYHWDENVHKCLVYPPPPPYPPYGTS